MGGWPKALVSQLKFSKNNYFGSYWGLNSGLMLARQELSHWSCTPGPFALVIFQNFCPGLALEPPDLYPIQKLGLQA